MRQRIDTVERPSLNAFPQAVFLSGCLYHFKDVPRNKFVSSQPGVSSNLARSLSSYQVVYTRSVKRSLRYIMQLPEPYLNFISPLHSQSNYVGGYVRFLTKTPYFCQSSQGDENDNNLLHAFIQRIIIRIIQFVFINYTLFVRRILEVQKLIRFREEFNPSLMNFFFKWKVTR